ncbi:MAG: hypothetical protein ACUVRL_02830 [Candidatus Saccharicenans sp.]
MLNSIKSRDEIEWLKLSEQAILRPRVRGLSPELTDIAASKRPGLI